MSKHPPPPLPTLLEVCEAQMRSAMEAFEEVMRQKTVVDALERRVDYPRSFLLATDHLRIAKLLLLDGLREIGAHEVPAPERRS